jgi:hypothetical protein
MTCMVPGPPPLRTERVRIAGQAENARVRRMSWLLVAIVVGFGLFAATPRAAACECFNIPVDAGLANAQAVDFGDIVAAPYRDALHEAGPPDTSAAPPGSDDPTRTHVDPGAWPEVIFIVALFVFGVVLRGSRSRRPTGGPADRRRP